ncbi:Disease resistance protein [Cynara cardunculus var. scolymus]|uniref:Disease resistance protein n=2 Tax=Cynara cardunculus var. scolymus TaxID=59895 RepID=A0A103YGX2_CYNCS|nr:Disease resistance protein [Cynara cardunculus var. scolymus]
MGDPIVSSVINQVMERSTSLAAQDFAVLWGLKADLRSLRTIFTQIQPLLADAEAKQRKNRALQDWLRKLRAASFEVENVLEEVSTEALLRRLHVERGIRNKVSTFFSASNPLKFRIRMVQKVKDIKELLDAIAAERINFELKEGITDLEVVADIDTRSISSIDSEIVGRDEEKEMIVEKICNSLNSLDHGLVHVHAIWGVGGLGKTTLAQLIYKDSRVHKLFDLKLWLRVSNDFSIASITREILKSIEGDSSSLSHMELEPLQQRLQEKLQRRRFLLVLDGVENENKEKWNGLMEPLKHGCRGSTVMVTTRSKKVADMMATLPALVHPLGSLLENDSWLLFKSYAFSIQRDLDRIELETIGTAIVKRCEGLPLAVKVIGSLMCLKNSISEWSSVLHSEVWDLADEGSHILPSLKLSYDNLPPHMRQCFALCSIFPKDHEMDKQLLVELWVAYGFVPSRGDADLYDLGEEIFNALVCMFFLQDVKECIFEGTTTCKMHDEMHALAQSVMKYECSSIVPGEVLKCPEEILHLSSNDILHLSNEVMAKAKSLRSLVTLGGFSGVPTTHCIFEQRYLRVLHLGTSSHMLTDLPESVGNLKFLRYLNISRSKIVVLPKSIVQLQNLQTLKLTFCEHLSELPEGIRYMRNLRHLNIHGCCSLDHMPHGMGQLRHLRRLSTFLVGQGEGVRISELQELNLLGGEFSIKSLMNVRHSSQAESANLKKKQNINHLNLSWGWKNSSKDNLPANNSEEVLEALQPHLNLKMLTISDYQGSHFPYWMVGLVNLVSIAFEGCRRCEDLAFLGKLPFLKVLELKEMDALRYLDDKEGDDEDLFPCLGKLTIMDCPNLIELPCIPNLTSLQIIRSNEKIFRSVGKLTTLAFFEIEGFEEMKSLPDDMLSNLTSLQEFSLDNCVKLESFPGLKENTRLNGLKKLRVHHCHSLTSFPSDWFQGTPNLRSLNILDCSRVKTLQEGLQHLTALEKLQVWSCPNLRCLPDELQNLESLKSLVIGDCELVKVRCEKERGGDWSKIAHLPYIKIDDQVIQFF